MIQMRSGISPAANLDAATKLIGKAKAAGARLRADAGNDQYFGVQARTPLRDHPGRRSTTRRSRRCAIWRASCRLHIHLGSLAIKVSPDKAANRSFLINPQGDIVARYDKIHMFDVDLADGESYRESRNYRPGERAVLADLPWGRLGLTVCYDLRFPALYRALAEAGATMLAIPSAFTKQTGEAHWHVLMRARAIENGSFVFAAAQGGKHENGRETYGHSLIVDPWGRVLAEGGTEPGVVIADIDPAQVAAARSRIPSLQHGRRFEMAEPLAEPSYLHRGAHAMISYALACDHGHTFESWFADSTAYDKQAKRGLVACPVCGSVKVEKAIMAPRLAGTATQARRKREAARAGRSRAGARKSPVAMLSPQEQEFRTKLKELREHLTKNADNVGAKFPEEARKMHYGEIEHRSIYGEARRRTPRNCRGRHRIPSAAGLAGREELAPRALMRPDQQHDAATISTMPMASRGVVGCLKMNLEIACANSTSTSASVRTLAAVAMAKARYQNCDASAPMKPANNRRPPCPHDRAQHLRCRARPDKASARSTATRGR